MDIKRRRAYRVEYRFPVHFLFPPFAVLRPFVLMRKRLLVCSSCLGLRSLHRPRFTFSGYPNTIHQSGLQLLNTRRFNEELA
jgi:hypothetical protein